MVPLQLKSQKFRQEREADWRRLSYLLEKVEDVGAKSLSDEQLLAIPVLYRSALSSLSVARATSLDQSLIEYLEGLCARAYFLVYGARPRIGERLAGFFINGWPKAVRSLWKETLVSALIVILSGVLGFMLVSQNPDWYYSLVGSDMASTRDPTSSAETLRQTIYGGDKDGLSAFAAYLFQNNARVALFAFAIGFAFGVPTAMLLVTTGASAGAMIAVFAAKGLGWAFGGWLIIHGMTEILAIIISGATGFRIGLAVAFPGEKTRLDAAVEAGRTTGAAIAGVVVMLLIAGLLEGFGRQLITSDVARWAIGLGSGVLWLGYFYLPRPERGSVSTYDNPDRLEAALRRSLVTPEGVDLNLRIGDAGQRIGAFLIDVVIQVIVLVVFIIVCGLTAMAMDIEDSEHVMVIMFLGFFVLRNLWFIGFELTPKAATIGKRIVGLRVAARDGGRLTAAAVITRNALREVEFFLPVGVILGGPGMSGGGGALLYLSMVIWTGIFLCFPLFNKDRLRAGDLIAGTWVVRAPKKLLLPDLADNSVRADFAFTDRQLDAYGVKELHVLEQVLRNRDRKTMTAVAQRIRRKIDWTAGPNERDEDFLAAYYAGLRSRLEQRMLFGHRRKDKFDRP